MPLSPEGNAYHRFAASATLLLLLAARPFPAMAQETAPAAPPQAAWIVNCSSSGMDAVLFCQMSQTIVAKDTGQRILTAVIAKKQDGKTLALTLGLPHGLMLPDGVTYWIDDGAKAKQVIETADQNGSYATIGLAASLLGGLKKGTILNVSVKAQSGGDIVLQLSLAGFSASLSRL